MLKHKLPILMILFIALSVISCRNKTKEIDTLSEYNNVKDIILGINSEQQKLYQQFSTKDERAKKYKEFCHDSLITITGYGNFLYNAVDASNDLVDGYADTIHDIHLKIYDNTAILTGRAKMYNLVGKDTLFEDIWISKVFMNFNGKWKMVLRSSGQSGVNYKKEIHLPRKALLAFEGLYGVAGDIPDTFKVEDNHLYQFGHDNLKLKYFAFDDSTFFTRDDPGSIVFKKNAGKISRFDWYTADGQIIAISNIQK
ncbi:MAG: nuclear transport factor 2 family protein [Chitinophagaceae bacterium]|nr:nuclear transport factor 2 family protein [Chitinophagaceae bacterium]